jgi:oleate hydratase
MTQTRPLQTPLRDPKTTNLWLVGGGIANLAAAAFAIRDAGVPGPNIHILEELHVTGGAMDGTKTPSAAETWVTRGGRMLTDETYLCLWDLCSSIPSLEDPKTSVREETIAFNAENVSDAKARLIDRAHRIIDASDLGFNVADRLELTRILAVGEAALGSKRIDELFSAHFFQTNFWRMWRTTFAFQKWHSAVELRRYFLRFVQEFPRIHTLGGIRRTKYNQYDSMIVPLQRWLVEHGVDVRFGTAVVDVDYEDGANGRRISALKLEGGGDIPLGPNDITLLTIGSITADSRFGTNDSVPELVRDRRDHGWTLWENLARKAPDLGRPHAFCGNVDEHKWESFTLTMRSRALLDRIVRYTRNEPGTGGLMTFFESGWHLSIVVAKQPHFASLPKDTYTLWGYGFEIDRVGDYVKKPMCKATGREVLTELLGQLGFDDIRDHVLATTDVTTTMMPYASALFACRAPGDRPKVVPDRAQNFGLLGQFVEIPEDVVYTVEYSVRGAMIAIYSLLGVAREIPPIYHGLLDPAVAFRALECAFH